MLAGKEELTTHLRPLQLAMGSPKLDSYKRRASPTITTHHDSSRLITTHHASTYCAAVCTPHARGPLANRNGKSRTRDYRLRGSLSESASEAPRACRMERQETAAFTTIHHVHLLIRVFIMIHQQEHRRALRCSRVANHPAHWRMPKRQRAHRRCATGVQWSIGHQNSAGRRQSH